MGSKVLPDDEEEAVGDAAPCKCSGYAPLPWTSSPQSLHLRAAEYFTFSHDQVLYCNYYSGNLASPRHCNGWIVEHVSFVGTDHGVVTRSSDSPKCAANDCQQKLPRIRLGIRIPPCRCISAGWWRAEMQRHGPGRLRLHCGIGSTAVIGSACPSDGSQAVSDLVG